MFMYSHWRALPLSTRALIAARFGIAKTGPTHVVNNQIESDGYKVEAIEGALNIDAIQAFTDSKLTDVQALWDLMVAKIEGRTVEIPVVEMITPFPGGGVPPVQTEESKSAPKKRGRKPKA